VNGHANKNAKIIGSIDSLFHKIGRSVRSLHKNLDNHNIIYAHSNSWHLLNTFTICIW